MIYQLKVVMTIELDAPSELDAIELTSDTFGDAMDIRVTSMEIKPKPKKRTAKV